MPRPPPAPTHRRPGSSGSASRRPEKIFPWSFTMQSNLESQATMARHVAVVMDGNGRWGARRGLDRSAGHRAGADAVERIVEAAPGLGIQVLTLFAFSSDNWQRPRA